MLGENDRQQVTLNYPRFDEFDRIVEDQNIKRTDEPIHTKLQHLIVAYFQLLVNRATTDNAKEHKREIEAIMEQLQQATTGVTKLQTQEPGAVIDAFRRRLSAYPSTGICDSMYMLVDDALYWDIRSKRNAPSDGELKDILKSLSCTRFIKSQPERADMERASNGWRAAFGYMSEEDGVRTENNGWAFCLPFFVVEHKKNDEEKESVAENQRLEYCTSIVRALSALGIHDFPIYGLATVGHYGTLCAAWCNSRLSKKVSAPAQFH